MSTKPLQVFELAAILGSRTLIQNTRIELSAVGRTLLNLRTRRYCSQTSVKHSVEALVSDVPPQTEDCKFGILFDIDGVLVRGRTLIPNAREALRKVIKSRIPVLFLTNSGCETEQYKADTLSEKFQEKIFPDQIILSHTPLKALDVLHEKHVVVSGQGPIADIARMYGFKKVSSVDDVCEACPTLDANDRCRRSQPLSAQQSLSQVEAVLLMGEPIHWERHLQVVIDILISSGHPTNRVKRIPRPHLPVIAVNTDLLWMSEAANPRFGHGAFLLCLETLYNKLTGEQLNYTAVLGKPNLLTYKYAERCMQEQARRLWRGKGMIERLYAIGDNVDTDVYGANVYNKYIQSNRERKTLKEHSRSDSAARRIESILVRTGVSDVEQGLSSNGVHLHRDTKYNYELAKPSYHVDDVLQAVNLVLEKEHFVT